MPLRRSRPALPIVLLLLLASSVGGWWWHARESAPHPPGTAAPAPAGGGRDVPVADPAAYAELNDTRLPPLNDLRVVSALLQNYRESLKTSAVPPLGFNEEIVRALTGANPLGLAFLPARHSSINRDGLWCDRWGTPYLFHPLSSAAMEVRSAGEDRRLFTADDLVLRPPQEAAPPE